MSRRLRVYGPHATGGTVELAGPEAHHARNVLRVKVGDTMEVFDGAGRFGTGRVAEVGKGRVVLSVESFQTDPPNRRRVTLVCAIPKHSGQGCLVDHGTQVGVDCFRPVVYQRSAVRTISVARWRRWAIEACKQCERNSLPEIREPATLDEVLGGIEVFDARIYGATSGQARQVRVAEDWRELVIFVGPEGGMTDEEERRLREHAVAPVRLGRYVMRIETASVALASGVLSDEQRTENR